MRLNTCYALLLVCVSFTAVAEHKHYKHLDLDWVKAEANRLSYYGRQQILDTVYRQRNAVQYLIEKHDEIVAESGEAGWKEVFESKYSDDFDRALVTSTLCKHKYEDAEECK
jgi:hypothetical protein